MFRSLAFFYLSLYFPSVAFVFFFKSNGLSFREGCKNVSQPLSVQQRDRMATERSKRKWPNEEQNFEPTAFQTHI